MGFASGGEGAPVVSSLSIFSPSIITMSLHFSLNGQAVQTPADPNTSLLTVLTQDFAVNGTKYGCGKAQCGSCTVLINGEPVRSCVTPASSAAGRSVTTLAGLSRDGQPNRLQQAFIDESGFQCGFCTPGMLLATHALLASEDGDDDDAVIEHMSGNLCRCTGYLPIIAAVTRARAAQRAAREG